MEGRVWLGVGWAWTGLEGSGDVREIGVRLGEGGQQLGEIQMWAGLEGSGEVRRGSGQGRRGLVK